MKASVIGAISIAIIVVIAGLVFFRSTGDVTPEANEEAAVELQDVSPAAQDLNQFLQVVPSDLPADSLAEDDKTVNAVIKGAPDSETGGEVVTISIEDSGFKPATITIKQGTTVKFVNNGQALHWPASAIHPTHQVLSGFDALRGLSTGETYSYTFVKKGTWKMHDHLFPNRVGSITVE